MIVQRWTFNVKIGCRDEVIKQIKAAVEETGVTPRICTYAWGCGPYDVVWYEVEFESKEDRRKYLAGIDWNNLGPAMAEFSNKQSDLVESPRTGELIVVH